MSAVIGLSACVFSSLLFGSVFVPVKHFNPGDGIFAQWMMCVPILFTGFATFAYTGFSGFYPLAMVGGFIWCLGNAAAFAIIPHLGLALFVLVCNITNCITGWAGGRFGLFGMKARIPASITLNYIGLTCVVLGGILFSRIKNNKAEERLENASHEREVSLENDEPDGLDREITVSSVSFQNILFSALLAALANGVLLGVTFVPVQYMIDNPDLYPNQPTDGVSYVFSYYFGIFLTSTLMFVIYAIIKKNQPYVTPELCLPGLFSGLMIAIGQTSFFVANQNLSQAITFPIITQLPGCVASAWSIFYYKEIQGSRNFKFLGIAMIITLTGALLVGLSQSFEL